MEVEAVWTCAAAARSTRSVGRLGLGGSTRTSKRLVLGEVGGHLGHSDGFDPLVSRVFIVFQTFL